MHILIAPDTFKASLAAPEAARAIQTGMLKGFPEAKYTLAPISDGGEGLLLALADALPNMTLHRIQVTGPQGKPVMARYGLMPEQKMAIIEWAEAAGLHSVVGKKQGMTATSTGVGELLLQAESQGATQFMIGLGGSATCDAAIGALSTLGFEFLNARGQRVALNGNGLSEIARIVADSPRAKAWQRHKITILHDVDNPFTGNQGAISYAKQKGTTATERRQLLQGFSHYAELLEKYTGKQIANIPGTGAAGGAGAGLYALLNAALLPGADWVLSQLKMAEKIQQADCIVVGEGSLDPQSLQGKAPIKIAALAKRHQKPVIALVGQYTLNAAQLQNAGITAVFSLTNGPMSKNAAILQTKIRLEVLALQIGKLLKICTL